MQTAGSTLNIIPSDASSIYEALSTSQTLALVRPTNPPPGLAGFLFDIDGDDIMRLRTEFSQHYLEDNTSVIDQMALPPIRISMKRYVGELVYSKPTTQPVSSTPDPLLPNLAMMPLLTPGAQQTQDIDDDEEASAEAAVTDTQSLWSYYLGTAGQQPNQSRQSVVFGYIMQLWLGRQLFTVETPFGVMTSMGIESCDFEQPEETKSSSRCDLTFMNVRIVSDASVSVGQLAGRALAQQSPVTQNGSAGTPAVTPQQQASILQQIAYPPQ
jgi:hypothetical protein